jgi:hypothetical protein
LHFRAVSSQNARHRQTGRLPAPRLARQEPWWAGGLGRWHDQAAWLVHFKQREDRPARIHDYRVGGEVYSLRLKGRAWITADKFQIVWIESELISPMPQIQVRNEQQVVEYGPVHFQQKKSGIMAPAEGGNLP